MQTINSIHNSELEVIHVIHRHHLSVKESSIVEAALIDAYPGLANMQREEGNNDYGPMNSKEIVKLYTAEEAQLVYNVLMITINRTALEYEYYIATRAAWTLDIKRTKCAEYILAVEKGLIVDVFIANEWKVALLKDFPEIGEDMPNRIGFIGERA